MPNGTHSAAPPPKTNMKIRNLFRTLEELTDYCTRNPDFPARCGLTNPIELWQFNPEIPLTP